MPMSSGKVRVVAVGGGHGLAATIRAVRHYAGQATAVVATADDGGSTGRLRRGLAMPAPGDLRRCLAAMAEGAPGAGPLLDALDFRFAGTDVEGHALGNLVLAGLAAVTGDFAAAVDEAGRLLGLDPDEARVLPATVGPVRLCGATAAGASVVGQVRVSSTPGIERVWLVPEPPGPDAGTAAGGANGAHVAAGVAAGLGDAARGVGGTGEAALSAPPGVVAALAVADQIVLGPGSLYSSVLSAAVVDEVRDAVAASAAQRVYVCNLRAEAVETRGYDVAAHIDALRRHGIEPDVVVVQRGTIPYGDVRAKLVEADVARPHGLAHDADRLATTLAALATVRT
ncbi:MAG TPA: gluconeogenesis factor YvcK family protein [Acidimicrobiales bacterium]|nr:gluconeogenesis factor YvcK family protein [Acidimicrobiales bacterium]